MKDAKLIIFIVVMVAMSGLFAGVKFYEYKINSTIAEIIASSDMLEVESFSFSIASRKLTIKNLNYTIKDTDIDGVYHYEEIVAYLAWDLLLHDGSPGIIRVADNIVAKNSSMRLNLPDKETKITLNVASTTYDNLAQDITSFMNILQNKNMLNSLISLSENTRCSFAKNENIVLTIEDSSMLKMSIKSTELKDFTGLKLAYFAINNVEASYAESKKEFTPIFGFNTFSITDLALPLNINELFKDVELDNNAKINFEGKLIESFANVTTPILTNMTIKDVWADFDGMIVRLNSYVFDWKHISPIQISFNSSLSFPADVIEQELNFSMPLLETIHVNFNTTLKEDLLGKLQKTNIVEVKNFANLEINTSIILNKISKDMAPNDTQPNDMVSKDTPTKDMASKYIQTNDVVINDTTTIASAYNQVSNGKIERVHAKYTDNGLLSYLLLNLGIKNSADAIALLVFLQMEFPQIKESTWTQISNFIHKPGNIEIEMKPKKPLTYDEFIINSDQLQETIKINASQGEKSLNESLNILYGK